MVLVLALVLDLTHAVVSPPPAATGPEKKAVALLLDAVEERTRIRWTVGEPGTVVIRRGTGPAEGYRIRSTATGVEVTGNDERGVLFGIGALLRALEMRRDSTTLPREMDVRAAPRYRLRGHQLGYRPKTNSYDAWDAAQWERYLRDLAVFGANAIELIPPRSDDVADSPHFPLPPMEMMVEMSRLAGEYGLDCWIWYPAMDRDYPNPETVEKALAEWGEVFRRLPRVDAVFVPGGDPGHTQPKVLFSLLEKQAANLRKYHPKARMWVSPQGFNRPWMEEFFGLVDAQPAWLAGVVFGPQVAVNLPELRARIPKKYPIRFYPDITHSTNAEFPVNDWDAAYAMTEEREVINPRPFDMAHIFRTLQPFAEAGFLTYSEGCNDDVNKAVWSALGWDPEADIAAVLRDYGRYFIGPEMAGDFAEGLRGLERNWRGPLLANAGVDTTLAQFQALERRATFAQRRNWRFQQPLYRAYYDAYVRTRLIEETARVRRARERLADGDAEGAAAELAIDPRRGAGAELRARVFELAEALFQSIHMQLSVERYGAIDPGRGANLDLIDRPVSDAPWLRAQIAAVRAMAGEGERRAAIARILHRTDPGPGGFYDDLGDPMNRPHLVMGEGFAKDPAFFHTARTGFSGRDNEGAAWPMAWRRHAEALYGNTLALRYEGLDPRARYRVRYVQAGDARRRLVRLVANGTLEIHGYRAKEPEPAPVEFAIPAEATASGSLTLTWQPHPDEAGNGRFVQVSEVWLERVR